MGTYEMIELLLVIAFALIVLIAWFYTHDYDAFGLSYWGYLKVCYKQVKEHGAFEDSNKFFVLIATQMIALTFLIALMYFMLAFMLHVEA